MLCSRNCMYSINNEKCNKVNDCIFQAFEVLASNALQVATINSLGDFILFLGKCFVTAVTGSVGLYFFRTNEKLTFYAAPTLLVCIFAFFVAHCILSLYEVICVTYLKLRLTFLFIDGPRYSLSLYVSE